MSSQNTGVKSDESIADRMAAVAAEISQLVNRETDVIISARITFPQGKNGATADYNVMLGDVCDRGAWKWVNASGETPEIAGEKAKVAVIAQADRRTREIEQLKKRASELGLVVQEAA